MAWDELQRFRPVCSAMVPASQALCGNGVCPDSRLVPGPRRQHKTLDCTLRGFRPQDPVTCSGQKDLRLIPLGGREHPWSSGYDVSLTR